MWKLLTIFILWAFVAKLNSLPSNLKPGIWLNTPENVHKLQNLKKGDLPWQYSGQFQSDIVLTPTQAQNLISRNGMINPNYRWPNNTIPYTLDARYTTKEIIIIERALRQIELVSCLKFVRRTLERDYVEVTAGNSGCHAYVGRIGGKQNLNLMPSYDGEGESGCIDTATIQHEFLHALGFQHQHCSHDRDDFVTIIWDNIWPGTEYNYEKFDSDVATSFNVSYDYASVMHYDMFAGSVNGEPVIVPHDSNAEIGQNIGLSRKDIEKLNRMYNCALD